MIVLRWESLKNRINSVIINISGKPVITVSVLIEEDIVSPLRLRLDQVEPTKTPENVEEKQEEIQEVVEQSPKMLSEMESEPVKETPLEEAMVVDVQETPSSPVGDISSELGSTPENATKEKKKRGSIMSRFSFRRSKRDSETPKTPNTTPKKKAKKGAVVWNEQNVDGTLQQIRLSFHWVKFKLVRMSFMIKAKITRFEFKSKLNLASSGRVFHDRGDLFSVPMDGFEKSFYLFSLHFNSRIFSMFRTICNCW